MGLWLLVGENVVGVGMLGACVSIKTLCEPNALQFSFESLDLTLISWWPSLKTKLVKELLVCVPSITLSNTTSYKTTSSLSDQFQVGVESDVGVSVEGFGILDDRVSIVTTWTP